MAYIKKNLIKGETITKEIKLHKLYWVGVVINFLLFPLIFPLFFGIKFLIKGLTLDQAITNKRVIVKSGFISRDVQEIKLSKVETVEFKQGILGRIFGYGSVKITGAGAQNTLEVSFVGNPRGLKNTIDEMIDEL